MCTQVWNVNLTFPKIRALLLQLLYDAESKSWCALCVFFFCCCWQGESTILDMDLMTEEKSAKSTASCKVGKLRRKRKQLSVSVDLTNFTTTSIHAFLFYSDFLWLDEQLLLNRKSGPVPFKELPTLKRLKCGTIGSIRTTDRPGSRIVTVHVT